MPEPVFLGPAPPDRPQRIVSLVPSQTEALAALGLDLETVGLTRFCVHPSDWKGRKTIVGGTKNVNVERVLGLEPDLVIASREENEREPVETLAEAGVPVWLSDIATVEEALSALRDLGRLTDRSDAADALTDEIAAGFDTLPPSPEPLRALYLIWRDPWMSVGSDTFIHSAMARGGLVNTLGDQTRYPTVTPDEMRSLRPDVVLLSSEPYPFRDTHLAEVQALVPEARVALVDGEAFSWYGPRLLTTPAELIRVYRLAHHAL